MIYGKKDLIKLLRDNNITVNSKKKSKIELMLLALDNAILKREDVVTAENEVKKKEESEKRPCGRPRKFPRKEDDPNKVIDPKYNRLRTIRTNPKSVKLTNVDNGLVTSYDSLYKAYRATHHGYGFFNRNNGKVVGGMKIEVIE